MPASASSNDPELFTSTEHAAIPLVPINEQSSELSPNNRVSTDVDPSRQSPESKASTSSHKTSSDKLSDLPVSPLPSRRIARNNSESSNPPPFIGSGPPSPSIVPYRYDSLPNNALGTKIISPPTSDGSTGKDPPKGRTSGESDRRSLPTMQNVREAISRLRRSSDAARHSPVVLDRPHLNDSRSHSPSPRPPPLRIFQQWSAGFHRGDHDDPFIPVDPFRFHSRFPCISRHHHHHHHTHYNHHDHNCACPPSTCFLIPCPLDSLCTENTIHFLTDALPRQIYLYLLLRLPALYFRRVARIFEDAEVSRPDIQRMIDAWSSGAVDPSREANTTRFPPLNMPVTTTQALLPLLPLPEDWSPPAVSPALTRFKHSWEAFIDSLLREWKTLNVVSALLSTAIVTMLQIPSAADDPITRYAALLSLVASLMSLSYGCVYIVRFVTMRSMYKASKWAEEAQKTKTMILWNVWVLLAMPSVWIAWSMIFFIVCVLSFVWSTGPSNDDSRSHKPFSPQAALVARTTVTILLALGILYFAMIVLTLKRYGRSTDDLERARVNGGTTGPVVQGGGISSMSSDLEGALSRRGRRQEWEGAGATTDRGVREEGAVREEWVEESCPVLDSGLGVTPVNSREQGEKDTPEDHQSPAIEARYSIK